ncbi:hypothetical protein Acr_00g0022940 [Actinidia rufa]|uniref:Uncharacterized protein n=1 Tax=Actinidia rufa TaxID=165716 RepID=A0A7J0DCP3_9ERIC|nr:hypothetical protein Acr_00g0022940 [Actinidia rufa]
MADESNPQTSPSKGYFQGKLLKVDVLSSPATELNTMTQGDLDRLRKTCSFPMGVQKRIPGKGKMVLSAGSGEVAFYEASFSASLRFPMHPIIKREFYPTIPREEGAVLVPRSWGAPVLSPTEEERFCQVFEKIGEGYFKIPVILNSRTFYKYFILGRVEVSSSGGGMVDGDIGGKAEGDIRGEADVVGPAPSSLSSSSSSRLGSQSDSRLFPELRSDAMSKRIKLNELAKVAAQKATSPSSKVMVISEGSEMASKKRASDDRSKGKQVAPLPEAKKIKIGSDAHAAPTRLPVVPEEGSSARQTLGEALGPQASVMASAATAEKILAGPVILGSSLAIRSRDFAEGAFNQRALVESSKMEMGRRLAEEVEARNEVVAKLETSVTELEKSQSLFAGRIIAAFKESDDFLEAVMGSMSFYFGDGFDFYKRQLAHHYPKLGVDLEDIEMDQDFLAQEEIEAERKVAEDRGEVSWRRESRNGQLPCLDRILVEIDQAKYSTSPKGEEETSFRPRPAKEYPGRVQKYLERWDVTGWVSGDVLGGTIAPAPPQWQWHEEDMPLQYGKCLRQ